MFWPLSPEVLPAFPPRTTPQPSSTLCLRGCLGKNGSRPCSHRRFCAEPLHMNWNQNSEPLSTTEPVAQNDRENVRMANSIIAQVSSNTTRLNEATQHFIVLAAEPGCGLARDSALVATNPLTTRQSDILRVLGSLSAVHGGSDR